MPASPPRFRPATPAQAQAHERRNWSVQVGEYHSGKLATRQVDFIADKFKRLFDDREGQVDHSGRTFRSVFTGFTESEAKAACASVQAKDLPCAPLGGR